MIDWLKDITVVDLTANVAGPFCTLILRDLGARVVKMEGLDGDTVRNWPPFRNDESTTFSALNRGKESLAIDLKDPRGLALAREVISRADVFVESLRPGAVARLGLGWEAVRDLNPRLVYLSLNAFGSVGPLAGQAGFDAIVQAYSGLMDVTGHSDGPPARVGTGIVDFGTGLWAALSVVGGLLQRTETGKGCRLESTLLGTAVSFMMHHVASASLAGVVPHRIGTAQHNSAPYEAVEAADGTLMLGVANDGLWERLLKVVDDGRLRGDERFSTNAGRVANRKELVAMLGDLLAGRRKEDVVSDLVANGVPASVIRTVDALIGDPQVEALDLMQETLSGASLPVVPVRANEFVPSIDVDSPDLGGQTLSIMRECGFDESTIEAYLGQGIVASSQDR